MDVPCANCCGMFYVMFGRKYFIIYNNIYKFVFFISLLFFIIIFRYFILSLLYIVFSKCNECKQNIFVVQPLNVERKYVTPCVMVEDNN